VNCTPLDNSVDPYYNCTRVQGQSVLQTRLSIPECVISTESDQTGTQSFTEKAERRREKLWVSSVLSVFLKNSVFVGVTHSGLSIEGSPPVERWWSKRTNLTAKDAKKS